MRKLLLILSVALLATLSSSGHNKLAGAKLGHLNSVQNDDTEALQALFDKGGVINLPAGRTFTTTRTLYLKYNNEIVYGNMCTITYTGTDAAIDFKRVNSQFYPVRNTISDLSINLQNPGAVGIRWQASYSSLKNCGIALTAPNQTGFGL